MTFDDFIQTIGGTRLSPWLETLPQQLDAATDPATHGNLSTWQAAVQSLPVIEPSQIDLARGDVTIGAPSDCRDDERRTIESALRQLHPWRKGPYTLFGLHIDTEWRSDWKWDRLAGHIQPLRDRMVLDVGCGNGYHCWRMAGDGARLVVGIDPFLLYTMQFQAIRHFIHAAPVHVLPVGIEALPKNLGAFDTVFSMGVLYHRRSPIDHLLDLYDSLRSGGELVLETLVIDGHENEVLVPSGRYAKMRNVWFIPSCAMLALWLKRCGFRQIRLIDVTPTTTAEQRSTDWMRFESLPDFLDANDAALTVEGYPAPKRAIFLATKP